MVAVPLASGQAARQGVVIDFTTLEIILDDTCGSCLIFFPPPSFFCVFILCFYLFI